MFSAPILEALEGGLICACSFKVRGCAVSVLSLWVSRDLVGSRCAVSVNYGDEGTGGGDKEGLQRESKGAERGETVVCTVDGCPAL